MTHPYPHLARTVISAHLAHHPLPTPEEAALFTDGRAESEPANDALHETDMWQRQAGCFVSIKNADGSLRGCIGTFMPTKDTIFEEISANAVSAATRDPRFPPIAQEELDSVVISVDVLSPPQRVKPGMTMDPKVYGVIVVQGNKRGLLLPDLEGVNTFEQQVAIAAQKAGLRTMDGVELFRFTVLRYKEEKKDTAL